MRKLIFTVLIIFSIAMLSCGGGGSSTDTSTATDNQTQPPEIQTATISGTINFIDTAYSTTSTQASITTKDKLLNGGQYIFVVAYSIDENGNPVREDMALVDLNTGQFTLNVPLNKPIALVFNDDVNEYITAVKDSTGKITAFSFDKDTTINLTVYNDLVVTTDIQPNVSDATVIAKLNADTDNDNIPDINDWDTIANQIQVEVVVKDASFNDWNTYMATTTDQYNQDFRYYHFFANVWRFPMVVANIDLGGTCNATYTEYKRYKGKIPIYLSPYVQIYTNDSIGNKNYFQNDDTQNLFKDLIKSAINEWNKVFIANGIPLEFYYAGEVYYRSDKFGNCETPDTNDDVTTNPLCSSYSNSRYTGVVNKSFRGIVIYDGIYSKDSTVGSDGELGNFTPYKYFDTQNWTINNLNDLYTLTISTSTYTTPEKPIIIFEKIRDQIIILSDILKTLTIEKKIQTFIHEIGHAIGLMHPFESDYSEQLKGKQSVMNYFGNTNYPATHTITDFDIQVLRNVYNDSDSLGVFTNAYKLVDFYNINCNLSTEGIALNVNI